MKKYSQQPQQFNCSFTNRLISWRESVLYEFEKFSYHLSESTKFDLFHDVWLEENILEHWETFPHLFGFDLGVTILMAIMRISLKSPTSKHSHIF